MEREVEVENKKEVEVKVGKEKEVEVKLLLGKWNTLKLSSVNYAISFRVSYQRFLI